MFFKKNILTLTFLSDSINTWCANVLGACIDEQESCMEYSAFDLARYVLKKCIDEDHPISNLQLQKILYYIQESFLRENNRKAFSEPIEAWQYGPVVPKVYDKYCIYGGKTIVWIPEAPDVGLKDNRWHCGGEKGVGSVEHGAGNSQRRRCMGKDL